MEKRLQWIFWWRSGHFVFKPLYCYEELEVKDHLFESLNRFFLFFLLKCMTQPDFRVRGKVIGQCEKGWVLFWKQILTILNILDWTGFIWTPVLPLCGIAQVLQRLVICGTKFFRHRVCLQTCRSISGESLADIARCPQRHAGLPLSCTRPHLCCLERALQQLKSWRSASLLRTDYKLLALAKVLATRLGKVMAEVIHVDYVVTVRLTDWWQCCDHLSGDWSSSSDQEQELITGPKDGENPGLILFCLLVWYICWFWTEQLTTFIGLYFSGLTSQTLAWVFLTYGLFFERRTFLPRYTGCSMKQWLQGDNYPGTAHSQPYSKVKGQSFGAGWSQPAQSWMESIGFF